MTRREIFYNITMHGRVDRPLFDLCGSPQTQVDSGVAADMRRILGIEGEYTGTGLFDGRILEALGIDTRMTGGFPIPPNRNAKTTPDGYVDEWGVERKLISGHYEIVRSPLHDAEPEQVRAFEYPNAEDIPQSFFDSCAEHARQLYEDTDYVVVAQHPCYGVLETGCWMFGFDDFLYRLAGEPETVDWFFERIWKYQKVLIERYYSALGKWIHCTTSGDDFGTQRGMFMSLPMFRRFVKPYYEKRVSFTKSFTHAAFQHHTCGSVFELIPDLIDCGIDIINPIQPTAYLMDPASLKSSYGKRISFWGGIDTQYLLTSAAPAEVEAESRRILDIFGNDGCYVFSPAHCIMEDVPAENVIAMYRAANHHYN